MDLRCRPVTAGFLVLGTISCVVLVYVILVRTHRPRFLALAEYWVYLPGTTLPEQDAIMTLMVRSNPYTRRGVSPIGPKEGLVFSDIRLHIALALRSKNPHIFRPDQFEEHIRPSEQALQALKDAKSLVKLRYVSEIPLADKTHLQFLLHAADAVAELGGGTVIFDVKAERLISRAELQTELKENFDATLCQLHTSILWRPSPHGGVAETRGLAKIGVTDLRTGEMEADQRVLGTTVLTEALRCVWDNGALPESVEVNCYDDTFKVKFDTMKNKMAVVKILREQAL